jgi:DNA-binding YbaB/EbfC family protein
MDIANLMQQAKAMQEKMASMQSELAKKTVVGRAGGGMVEVAANGQGEILRITLEDIVLVPSEKEMLQDLIVAATNDALRRAKELSKQELAQLTGGLNLPDLANFLK